MRSEPCRHHGKIHYAFFFFHIELNAIRWNAVCWAIGQMCVVYACACNVKMSFPRAGHIIIYIFFFISLKILANADSSSSFSLLGLLKYCRRILRKIIKDMCCRRKTEKKENTCIFQHCPLISLLFPIFVYISFWLFQILFVVVALWLLIR